MQNASNAAVPYLRQALGVQRVLGDLYHFVYSMVHLWSVLRLNLRPDWRSPSAADLLHSDWNLDRRTADREVYPQWGYVLAKIFGLGVPPVDPRTWGDAVAEKTWLDQHNPPLTPAQRLLFATPLLTATRLQTYYDDARYQAEAVAVQGAYPTAEPTEKLEVLMANEPLWLMRKIGLHGSHRVQYASLDACRTAHGHSAGTSVPNCDEDPWWAFQEVAAALGNPRATKACEGLRHMQAFLERHIGQGAVRFACPFAQCDLCTGRGHGKNKGSRHRKSNQIKSCLGLKGGHGSLATLKRGQQLGLRLKGLNSEVVDLQALHSIVGEGCIVGSTIWDRLEVHADHLLRTNVSLLQNYAKEVLKPVATPPAQGTGLGIPEVWVGGRARSTRNLRGAAAALEQPQFEHWIAFSPFAMAILNLSTQNSCDRWRSMAEHCLGLFFQKRCLWCNGGGHYWFECAGFAPLSRADWAGDANMGFWLRPAAIYHTPSAIMREWLQGLVLRSVLANQGQGLLDPNAAANVGRQGASSGLFAGHVRNLLVAEAGRNPSNFPSGGIPAMVSFSRAVPVLPQPQLVPALPAPSTAASASCLAPSSHGSDATSEDTGLEPANPVRMVVAALLQKLRPWAVKARKNADHFA